MLWHVFVVMACLGRCHVMVYGQTTESSGTTESSTVQIKTETETETEEAKDDTTTADLFPETTQRDDDATPANVISVADGTAVLMIHNMSLQQFVNDSDTMELFRDVLAAYITMFCANSSECPDDVTLLSSDDIVIVMEDLAEVDSVDSQWTDLVVPVFVSNEDKSAALVPASVIEGAVEEYAEQIQEEFGYKVTVVRDPVEEDDGNDSGGDLEDWELALIIAGSVLAGILLIMLLVLVCYRCRANTGSESSSSTKDDKFQWEGGTMDAAVNGNKAVSMNDIIAQSEPSTPKLSTYTDTASQAPIDEPSYNRSSYSFSHACDDAPNMRKL